MLRDPTLRAVLQSPAIPALPEALVLFEQGHASSLAPANRRAWGLLDRGSVDLQLTGIDPGSKQHQALLELLVDPQTCGPLLISIQADTARRLTSQPNSAWTDIGSVQTR